MATKNKSPKQSISYVNVNRTSKGYKDKYKKDVDAAVRKYAEKLGKMDDGSDFTPNEWKTFFKTVLIPLDKESEKKMIDLFVDNRDELNTLLILHNTKASDNLAEVYYKRYEKESPTKWHDLDDFKQMALEGLSIAAQRFDVNSGNKFITYATWWVLNRVMKPNQEKGAFVTHTSFDAPISAGNGEDNSTFESVFNKDMIAGGWDTQVLEDSITTPADVIDNEASSEAYDVFSSLKAMNSNEVENLDKEKVKLLVKSLLSVVESKSNNYDTRQIYMYMFRRVFNKCSYMLEHNTETTKMNRYANQAAKSKTELLRRIKMNESQYESFCQGMLRGCKENGI